MKPLAKTKLQKKKKLRNKRRKKKRKTNEEKIILQMKIRALKSKRKSQSLSKASHLNMDIHRWFFSMKTEVKNKCSFSKISEKSKVYL